MTTPEVATQPAAADAKTFDINAFLGKFTPANWTVRVPTRGDLLVEIERLRTEISTLGDNAEQAVGDKRSKARLIAEHNKLVEEFERENVSFTFRPSELADWITARKAFVDDGGDIEAEGSAEALYPYMWAQTCIEPEGVTTAAFLALKARVGDVAMSMLHRTWLKANNGGELVDAPFSPRPLPIPTNGKRSKS